MPYYKDYKKKKGKRDLSLSDLIEHGHDAYDSFEDMPYEVRQALSGYVNGYTFEHIPINSRFLPFSYPYFF